MSYFTKEALQQFNEMCAEGLDFGEGPVYDFARCVMANGEYYGVSDNEKCEKGRRAPDKEKQDKGDKATRMAKLKAAFIRKIGREMTPQELKQATLLIEKTKGPGEAKKPKGSK